MNGETYINSSNYVMATDESEYDCPDCFWKPVKDRELQRRQEQERARLKQKRLEDEHRKQRENEERRRKQLLAEQTNRIHSGAVIHYTA